MEDNLHRGMANQKLCAIAENLKTGVRVLELQPSNYFLDKFVSFDLSSLSSNNTGKREISSKWVNAFILNSAFRYKFEEPKRLLIMNLLRRVESSFHQYNLGSSQLDEYLLGDKRGISRYFSAVVCFEIALSHLYQAYMFGQRLTGIKLFNSNDNSSLDRLNKLYNISKHYDGTVSKGEIDEVNTIPIWITNEGFKSIDKFLSYNEVHEMMNEMEYISNELIK
ncbi:hypothetical protein ACFOQM_10105 [Paenibacillus sp. GCM10012307]